MLKRRTVYNEEHELLRNTVRRFVKSEIAPHFDAWERAGIVDRSVWDKAGAVGLLCPQAATEYGGAGGTLPSARSEQKVIKAIRTPMTRAATMIWSVRMREVRKADSSAMDMIGTSRSTAPGSRRRRVQRSQTHSYAGSVW